jgi:hypothetical protein
VSGTRRAVARALTGRGPRAAEPPWKVGEPVLIAACDRRTGRPERPGLSFDAVVTAVDEEHVTASAGLRGDGSSYEFFTCDGWDAWPGAASPWRILHAQGDWRF